MTTPFLSFTTKTATSEMKGGSREREWEKKSEREREKEGEK